MEVDQQEELDAERLPGVAAFEHLTGPSQGTVTWLNESTSDIHLNPNCLISVSEAHPGDPQEYVIARLHPAKGSYEIEATETRPVWVNGVRVTEQRLKHGDMIEFCETGPMSRFCLYPEDKPLRKTVADILGDAIAYLRVSRQPYFQRMLKAIGGSLRRLVRETTILFRTAVVIAIVALGTLTYQQHRLNTLLRLQFESDISRLDSVAGALARASEEALIPSDLVSLRQEIRQRLSSNADRLAALELRSQASARVIADSIRSVVFLQGAYGFREKSSGRMLRYVLDANGRPMILAGGQPNLSLEGDGEVANRKYTGTAFSVGDGGALITNRHVALPWEDDDIFEELGNRGLEPVMTRLIVYPPGRVDAVSVELVRASEDGDLAVLRQKDAAEPIAGLPLGDVSPKAGDEVIVMGYPTGLRAMLAQSGEAFVAELQEAENTDFWGVAARLAAAGLIAPLASRGIVGQTTLSTIVYDAETTHGGSGGPVLDINGSVIAVNFAGVGDFSGSNLGVPVAKVRALLEDAGLQ